jgi:sterol desaturase/sphingolipid hydroxylase (fatty acid hydroxylase superfamily)
MPLLNFISQNEATFRLTIFLSVFMLMALWEWQRPCKTLTVSKLTRWANNLGLITFNTVLLRLLFPTATAGMAAYVNSNGWGLLNTISLPLWLSVLLTIVLMDLAIYFQHRLFHVVPVLWRLHKVHHADMDIDVTTGARFHSIEILLSMLIKFGVIVLLGPMLVAVVLFEVLLNATAMFNHSNIKIPKAIDNILRLLVVTPDMHRVHHSVIETETNSNYGFNLPWWDRIFGSYCAQPKGGHQAMKIGLNAYQNPTESQGFLSMLMMPFKR